MAAPSKPFQDQVPHVSGDSGVSDIFHGGDDVGEPLTRAESLGHETVKHHKYRSHEPKNATDTEILLDEGADLPHATHAGHVDLPGAVDS